MVFIKFVFIPELFKTKSAINTAVLIEFIIFEFIISIVLLHGSVSVVLDIIMI